MGQSGPATPSWLVKVVLPCGLALNRLINLLE